MPMELNSVPQTASMLRSSGIGRVRSSGWATVSRLIRMSALGMMVGGLALLNPSNLQGEEKAAVKVAPGVALNAAAVVKYRHNQMEMMGKYNKAIRAILQGEVAYNDQLLGHAQGLETLTKSIPALYPPGTGPDKVKSDSKKNIWTEPEKFKAASDKMNVEMAAFVTAVKGGDAKAIQTQYSAMTKACGACHDSFRVEE